jgi:hypothetical protein
LSVSTPQSSGSTNEEALMPIEIQGADQLLKLSKALKAAGDKELQKELSKAISRATKPLKDELRQSAMDTLPKKGGLAREIAASKIVTRRGQKGVRIVGKNVYSLYHLDKGVIRHGKGHKVQATRPGWWTIPTELAAPHVRAEIVTAMDEITKQIDRSV